jgi:hypothetical protein
VQSGSSSTSISFLSKSGSTVSPTPDLRVVSLSGTTLSESVYPATGGAAPVWTFSGTPTSTTILVSNVTAPGGVMFRYYDYLSGQVNSTPLTVPLTATTAARAAHVSVSMTVQDTTGTSSQDLNSPITLTDNADLRLESASPIAAQDNLPCV